MSQFEFVFSLYGLLLGLGIADLAGAWIASAFNAVYAAVLIWLFAAPTRRQAAMAAWLGVAILVLGVGILS